MLDGEEKDMPAGSVVFLREPKVKRYARAEEPGTTVLAIGGKPGVHEVSAWEYFFMAYAVVDEDPERAIAEIQAGLAEKPDHAGLHFHLACIYARAGRLDEAGVALDRALELDPKLQQWADEDEDLEALRASRRNEALSRRAALGGAMAASSVAPDTPAVSNAPCVLASPHPSHPGDEASSRERLYESPGRRSPAARSRSAGTGSASGRATMSTAP